MKHDGQALCFGSLKDVFCSLFFSFSSNILSQGLASKNYFTIKQSLFPHKSKQFFIHFLEHLIQKSGDLHLGHLTLFIFNSPLKRLRLQKGQQIVFSIIQFLLKPFSNY